MLMHVALPKGTMVPAGTWPDYWPDYWAERWSACTATSPRPRASSICSWLRLASEPPATSMTSARSSISEPRTSSVSSGSLGTVTTQGSTFEVGGGHGGRHPGRLGRRSFNRTDEASLVTSDD